MTKYEFKFANGMVKTQNTKRQIGAAWLITFDSFEGPKDVWGTSKSVELAQKAQNQWLNRLSNHTFKQVLTV